MVGIFLEQYAQERSLTVVGDGTQRRDFYPRTGRCCRELSQPRRLRLRNRFFGQFFNVASGENVAIIELALLISDDIRFQAPIGFFFCDVTAARTASSSACPIDRSAFPSGQRLRSSTTP